MAHLRQCFTPLVVKRLRSACTLNWQNVYHVQLLLCLTTSPRCYFTTGNCSLSSKLLKNRIIETLKHSKEVHVHYLLPKLSLLYLLALLANLNALNNRNDIVE